MYFDLLNSKTDSIALTAFIALSTGNPEKVADLATEYKKANISPNRIIGQFSYDFLKYLSSLTAYYKANRINFSGSAKLKEDIAIFKRGKLTFAEKRKLEDRIINNLSLSNVTVFEYWRLVYMESPNLNYSGARILDIFYTRHWNQLIHDKKQLDLYLKKSFYLDSLGGVVYSHYLTKFVGATDAVIALLKRNISRDKAIMLQNKRAVEMAVKKPGNPYSTKKTWAGNFDTVVTDLEGKFNAIVKKEPDSEKRDNAIVKLYSNISYTQIGLALSLVENVQFKYPWGKYSFIKRDFGFFDYDFEDEKQRKIFLDYYSSHTEQQVYVHFLALAEVDYRNTDGSLNYDKIFELLKYDVVGGNEQEDYLLIKLLELNFKTTIGFPAKLCNSAGLYGCNSTDRTKVWMAYLQDHHLLKKKHEATISFGY